MAELERRHLSRGTMSVIRYLAETPDMPRYGKEICDQLQMAGGSVHPILERLTKSGWVESTWEQLDPSRAKRPARRYYRLTDAGVIEARKLAMEMIKELTRFEPISIQEASMDIEARRISAVRYRGFPGLHPV